MITKLPNTKFMLRENGEWLEVHTENLFIGKNILFALSGAFTPTCSSTHLPQFDLLYDELKGYNIDNIYCLSVNDAFVMNAWARELSIKNIKMLPDGNGDFTRLIGMLVDKSDKGFGMRSWRYALVTKGMEIEKTFIEDGKEDNLSDSPFVRSSATSVLNYLRGIE
jgi:peroxiredoxin